MINQTQYSRLCENVKHGDCPLAADVADLLESYEILHALNQRLCESGSQHAGVDAFKALYTEDGDERVELLVHGRARQ